MSLASSLTAPGHLHDCLCSWVCEWEKFTSSEKPNNISFIKNNFLRGHTHFDTWTSVISQFSPQKFQRNPTFNLIFLTNNKYDHYKKQVYVKWQPNHHRSCGLYKLESKKSGQKLYSWPCKETKNSSNYMHFIMNLLMWNFIYLF